MPLFGLLILLSLTHTFSSRQARNVFDLVQRLRCEEPSTIESALHHLSRSNDTYRSLDSKTIKSQLAILQAETAQQAKDLAETSRALEQADTNFSTHIDLPNTISGHLLASLTALCSPTAAANLLVSAWEDMRPFAAKILLLCRLTPDYDDLRSTGPTEAGVTRHVCDSSERSDGKSVESGESNGTGEPDVWSTLVDWGQSARDEEDSIYAWRLLGHTIGLRPTASTTAADGSMVVSADTALCHWISGIAKDREAIERVTYPAAVMRLILDEIALVDKLRTESYMWSQVRGDRTGRMESKILPRYIISRAPLSYQEHSGISTESLEDWRSDLISQLCPPPLTAGDALDEDSNRSRLASNLGLASLLAQSGGVSIVGCIDYTMPASQSSSGTSPRETPRCWVTYDVQLDHRCVRLFHAASRSKERRYAHNPLADDARARLVSLLIDLHKLEI